MAARWDGYRLTVERQKLCVWLESEQRKLAKLGPDEEAERAARAEELEREFRARLDRLYGEGVPDPKIAKSKLN
jgi:hypothetical protein